MLYVSVLQYYVRGSVWICVDTFALHSSGIGGGIGRDENHVTIPPASPASLCIRSKPNTSITNTATESCGAILASAWCGQPRDGRRCFWDETRYAMVRMYYGYVSLRACRVCVKNGYMVIWSGSVLFEHISRTYSSPKTSQNKPSSSNRVKYLALW